MHAFQIFLPSLECRDGLGTQNLNTIARALSRVSNSLLFLLSFLIFSRCGDWLSGHNMALLSSINAHCLRTRLGNLPLWPANMWHLDPTVANTELFVFADVSKSCGVGIQFPCEPVSLFHSDVNKPLPTAGPTLSFQVTSVWAAQAQGSPK